MANMTSVKIEKMIYVIRGCKVILDSDLAKLYGVAALSGVLGSKIAIKVNISIIY